MFNNDIDEILEFCLAMENLPLSVNYVFLQVKCNIFCNAEILHCVWDCDSQLIAYPEKVIYTSFTGEDHG